MVGARLQEAHTRVIEMSTEEVERRVARTLLRLANQAGRKVDRGIEIDFPISRQNIAEMTGTTLHTVSRILSAWEQAGIVESGRQRVTLRDAHRLTGARQLTLVLDRGTAIRWGCAVGRDGFRWAGLADVGRKVMWPRWTPPKDMIARSPEKAKWKNGMPGGPDNPLGARALYLFQNGNDTLYRIHGTTEPLSIGKNASSGCIRMVNQDVIELYRRAPVGTRVIVMAEGV
jgi:hypothetical protein